MAILRDRGNKKGQEIASDVVAVGVGAGGVPPRLRGVRFS